MKALKDLKNMNITELNNELLDVRKQQFQLRLSKANGALSKPHLISAYRKYVARIKTIMTEKVGMSDA